VTNPPLWRQTPPVIFALCLGFMDMTMAWYKAGNMHLAPPVVGDVLLWLAPAYFVFFLGLYIAKFVTRPAIVIEDMAAPPARAGVSALAMALMIMPLLLMAHGVELPLLWEIAVVLHLTIAALVGWVIWREPADMRAFTPFQFLAFAGIIVAPVAGVPLGHIRLSYWITVLALVPLIVITVGFGRKLLHTRPPAPLRPSLVIVLAQVGLFSLAFGHLGVPWAFTLFYWMAWALALVFLAAGFWLTKGGWSPAWSAFTFPVAVFANLQLFAISKGYGILAVAGFYAALAIGSAMLCFVLFKTTLAFKSGMLSAKSGAATA